MDEVRNRLKGRFVSLRSRIIFLCCCIGMSAAIVLTVSFLFFYRNSMKREYQNQIESRLEDTAVVFDNYMENVSALANNWYQSTDGILARVEKDYNIMEHVSFLNYIRNTMFSLGYVQSFYVINIDGNVEFWTGSGRTYTQELNDKLQELVKENKNAQQFFLWDVDHLYLDTTVHLLSCQISDAPYGSPQYTGAVVLNIDLSELQKRMFQEKEGNVQIVITDENGRVVLASDESQIGIDNYPEKMKDTENYHLSMPLGINGFSINAWYSYSSKLTAADDFFWITIVLFIVMGVSVILAVFFGNYIARPLTRTVRKIKENQSEQSTFFNGEGRDELRFLENYAQNVGHYIQYVKENDQKNRIIYNLLRNDKNVDIQPLLLEKGILYDQTGYWAIAVEFVCSKEKVDIEMLEEIRKAIASRFSSALEKKWKQSCYEHGLRYLLFLVAERKEDGRKEVNEKEDDRTTQLEEYLQEELVQLEEQYPEVEFFIVISRRQEAGAIPCKPVVYQINNRLSALRICGRSGIDCDQKMERRIQPHEKTQEACLNALKTEDRDDYQKAIEDMLEESCDASRSELLSWMVEMADRINSVKAAMNRQYKKADIGELYEEVEKIESKEEMLAWFDSLYDSIREKMGQVKQTTTAGLAEEAVDYILEHFSDDELGAYSLAQRLHISPQYFGQLFREFTGKSVNEYITRVRMEKARNYLLTRPDLEMMEVAKKVGYRSASYFSTAFKKYYGVSPSKLHSSLNAEELFSVENETISKN